MDDLSVLIRQNRGFLCGLAAGIAVTLLVLMLSGCAHYSAATDAVFLYR